MNHKTLEWTDLSVCNHTNLKVVRQIKDFNLPIEVTMAMAGVEVDDLGVVNNNDPSAKTMMVPNGNGVIPHREVDATELRNAKLKYIAGEDQPDSEIVKFFAGKRLCI